MARIISVIAVLLVALGVAIWLSRYYALDSPIGGDSIISFEISKGEGFNHVLHRLQEQKVIRHPFWFQKLAMQEGAPKKMKAGEYEIQADLTPRELLARFMSGRVNQHVITVVEGWRFSDFLKALNRHPDLAPVAMGKSPDEIMTLLGAPGANPEGQFFPDTYYVSRGTSDLEVLRRAYNKMQTVLQHEWVNRAGNLPYNNPYEALIMASIVEKETGKADERDQIAGVFIRRLNKKMRLQTDPTVIYGMGDSYNGNIKKSDLTRDTAYNTYTRGGLPPTPIALPGQSAIRAAMNPADGTALYFVARGDGSHVFSSTLAEHNQAVDQFQRH